MKKLNPFYLTLSLLFFLSLLLRISLLRNGPFDIDCLNLTIQSQNVIKTLTPHTLFGPGYPLLIILGVIFIQISSWLPNGDPFFAVNFMSALFGSFCVCLFYILLLNLFNSQMSALMGALILSMCPIFLDISLFGMGHTPTLFFLLSGILLLLKFQKTINIKYLWLSGLSIGLMGSVRFQEMILMFIPLSYLFWFGPFDNPNTVNTNKNLKNYSLLWLQAFLITFCFHLPLLLSEGYQEQFSNFFKITVSENAISLLSPSLIRAFNYLILNSSWPGIIAVILGIILLIKDKKRMGIFCVLWIIIPLSFYGNLWSTAPRFLNIILPAIIMAQVYVLSHLMKINKVFFFSMIFILGIIIYIPFQRVYANMKYLHTHSLIPNFAKWISSHTETNAIIIPADEGKFIEYFGHRKIVYRPTSIFSIPNLELNKFKEQLDEWLEQNIPIYITYDGLYSYNPEHKFSKMMEKNYLLETVVTVPFQTWHFSPFNHQIDFTQLIRISKLK